MNLSPSVSLPRPYEGNDFSLKNFEPILKSMTYLETQKLIRTNFSISFTNYSKLKLTMFLIYFPIRPLFI